MNSLNDLDPEVRRLYEGLISGKYQDCNDYLVSPVEEYNVQVYKPKELTRKDLEIRFDGQLINDYYESDEIDYGM